ncbi:MAG: hypothetical protein KJS64_00085 [Acidobacteria bacterium]|nr:hypothetical protein [Acidobacteriota bacterium]
MTDRAPAQRWRPTPPLAAFAAYFSLSLLLMRSVLPYIGRRTTYPSLDPSLLIWANGWVAHALTHFENPLYSSYVFSPHGLNLLANPCSVGLALVSVPLTLLFGPLATFNLQLLLMPVASAMAMYVAVRPLVARSAGRLVAGLLWGFNPLVLCAMNWGWTNVGYLVTPPLVASYLYDTFVTQQRTPAQNGRRVAVVVAVQLLLFSELVANMFIVVLVVVTVGLALQAWRHGPVRDSIRRLRDLVVGAAPIIFVVVAPLAAYALYGPAPLAEWVWPRGVITGSSLTSLSTVVSQSTSAMYTFVSSSSSMSPTYLGWAGLIGVAALVVTRRRWAMTWWLVALALGGLWLSLGDHVGVNLWSVVWHAPVVHNMMPIRFVVWVWFAVSILAAAAVAVPNRRRSVSFVGAGLIVGSWVVASHSVFPIVSQPVHRYNVISNIARQYPRPPNIVAFPAPDSGILLIQQANEGFRFRTSGGFGPSLYNSTPDDRATYDLLNDVSFYGFLGRRAPRLSEIRQLRESFARWGVDAVVVPNRLSAPIPGFFDSTPFRTVMASAFGRPTGTSEDGSTSWWRLNEVSYPQRIPDPLRVYVCDRDQRDSLYDCLYPR